MPVVPVGVLTSGIIIPLAQSPNKRTFIRRMTHSRRAGKAANKQIALLSVALVDVWKGVGFATVIYIAGILSIRQEYYEALEMDGGGAFRKFWNIILP